MKKSVKFCALLLAFLLCLPLLAACGKKNGDSSGTTPNGNPNNGTVDGELTDIEKRAQEKDNLPDWVSTEYVGRKINTLSFFQNYEVDINGSETGNTGDIVTDLVYKRNEKVKARLGIEIKNHISDVRQWADYSQVLSRLANSQEDEYQIVYILGNSVAHSGVAHYFFSDVTDLPLLSLDSPWWNIKAMENLSYDGKALRLLVGDLTLTNYNRSGVTYVNIDLYNRYCPEESIDDLYDLAIAGNWTLNELYTRSSKCYNDINDDGLDPESTDIIGFGTGNAVRVDSLVAGLAIDSWTRDSETNYIQINYDFERASNAVDKLIQLLFENEGGYFQDSYLYVPSFINGNIVFYENFLECLSRVRQMEANYGVLPLPKLDTEQKEYTSWIQGSATMATIPTTCIDRTFASVVLEALCAESYRIVVLPYMETCMKVQYVRDSRVGAIIDLILKSATYDYMNIYNLGQLGSLVATVASSGVNTLSSQYQSAVGKAEELLVIEHNKYFPPTVEE